MQLFKRRFNKKLNSVFNFFNRCFNFFILKKTAC
jgi:hypothetical protein